jgi:hypothetical protein
MNEDIKKYKLPRWFKIVVITYISLAILFFLIFLITIIAKGDHSVEQGTTTYTIIFWSGISLLWFTIIGVPSLAFLSWGLSSRNKILKYSLYLLSAGWLIFFIIQIIIHLTN